jgi:GMP synthase-like glutamine amidotransferase
LLGRFLSDRTGPSPLPERSLFTGDGRFRWGTTPPLEKVVWSREDLDFLALNPLQLQNAVTIIEPWDHVGHNAAGEPLRASTNVAYVLQKIADCDSILLPVWSSGVLDLDALVPLLSSSLAIVFEGGAPSVYDESSFSHVACPRDDLFALVERLLLTRPQCHAPTIFICLGHQLAAEGLVRLVRRGVDAVLGCAELQRDRRGDALSTLQSVCARIREMGEKLEVHKGDGIVVAQGWSDPCFAVARNESPEWGTRVLTPYHPPNARTSLLPKELILAQQVVADSYEAVIDTMVGSDKQVSIEMFHGDEANEEAVLFANWAFGLLHDAIVPYRAVLAGSELAWLLDLPAAVEILCSTTTEEGLLTECAALGIYYRDLETKRMRRSFTCQFHPELLAGQIEVGRAAGPPPSYSELKRDDGARIFARMLYEGAHE